MDFVNSVMAHQTAVLNIPSFSYGCIAGAVVGFFLWSVLKPSLTGRMLHDFQRYPLTGTANGDLAARIRDSRQGNNGRQEPRL